MTVADPDAFLRDIFQAGLGAADPAKAIPRFLPDALKGWSRNLNHLAGQSTRRTAGRLWQ